MAYHHTGRGSPRGLEKSDLIHEVSSSQLHVHYEILEELGHGAFGVVLKAQERNTGEIRVCKEVNIAGKQPQEIALMKQEIQLLRKLEHPHVVQLFQYAEDGFAQRMYLIMEMLPGGDCGDLLEEHGPSLDERLIAKCVRHLLLGTAYCHSLGILHRDIKPENMMLTENNDPWGSDVKVIDFGISKMITPHGSSAADLAGTPQYMAPELMTNQAFGDPVDLWSTGASAYQMLTTHLPFGLTTDFGGNFQAFIANVSNSEPDWEAGWENRSPYSQDFCERLLIKNSGERMSLREALKHPWILKFAPAGHTADMASALKGFKTFSDAPHFVQACSLLIASHMEKDQLKTIGRAFDELDQEGDGMIPVDDLAEALLARQWWFQRDPDFAQKCAEHADLNGDGHVSFTEFAAASIHAELKDNDVAEHAFDLFDTDGDGIITQDDISAVLETPTVKVFEEETGIDYLDVVRPLQNKEEINFMQFRALLQNSTPLSGTTARGPRTPASTDDSVLPREQWAVKVGGLAKLPKSSFDLSEAESNPGGLLGCLTCKCNKRGDDDDVVQGAGGSYRWDDEENITTARIQW